MSTDAPSRDSRIYASQYGDDSRAPSRAGSDDDNVNTQTVAEKYNITPTAGLLLFPEDIEKDDWLHNPGPDDEKKRECDIFTKRGLVNVGGLALITIGILILFIGFPILYVSYQFSKVCYSHRHANGSQHFCEKVYGSSGSLQERYQLHWQWQGTAFQEYSDEPYRPRHAEISTH